MNRTQAAQAAEDTLQIIENGYYLNSENERIDIGAELKRSIENAVLYRPEETDRMLEAASAEKTADTSIEVTGETTLAAVFRLLQAGEESVCCLNFASAKNPGGGFRSGARAQEESLARASGLYPTIAQMSEMYEHNARVRTCLYSDYMIYSPDVPVFRDDDGKLLNQPYLASMITAPAVNAGVVREREPGNTRVIGEVMANRIRKILAVASYHHQSTLVLGAFGCGVFRNDPVEVARIFKDVSSEPPFRHAFHKIVFAVYDTSARKETYKAFQRAFEGS